MRREMKYHWKAPHIYNPIVFHPCAICQIVAHLLEVHYCLRWPRKNLKFKLREMRCGPKFVGAHYFVFMVSVIHETSPNINYHRRLYCRIPTIIMRNKQIFPIESTCQKSIFVTRSKCKPWKEAIIVGQSPYSSFSEAYQLHGPVFGSISFGPKYTHLPSSIRIETSTKTNLSSVRVLHSRRPRNHPSWYPRRHRWPISLILPRWNPIFPPKSHRCNRRTSNVDRGNMYTFCTCTIRGAMDGPEPHWKSLKFNKRPALPNRLFEDHPNCSLFA